MGASFALGVLVTLLSHSLGSPRAEPEDLRLPPLATNNGDRRPGYGSKTPAKPWGNLEYGELSLEPDELFLGSTKPQPASRWIFENYPPQQLVQLLNSCGLTASQKSVLLETNRWEPLTNGCAIPVPDEVVVGLSKSANQRLYPILARTPANVAQYYPFRFPLKGFEERFAGRGLSSQTLETIRRLTYTNGGLLCFSAAQPLRSALTTNEFRTFVRALYGVPTLRLQVRLHPGCNIEALVKYWGKGGREKTIRPLLESLARIPEGATINVASLFPPFARLRLYTYPDPATDPSAAREDCYYTSLNFFKDEPDARFMDSRNTREEILAPYQQTRESPEFGDLLALLDSSGNAVHICVYVADDVVFTKNGGNYLQPWV
ncbi:MAG TPA: hypothetical protein VH598_12830, partial [Verrucomicrobiae bacterium]|nr:hypothetical protein [Verrucomicrobiae bacterium]